MIFVPFCRDYFSLFYEMMITLDRISSLMRPTKQKIRWNLQIDASERSSDPKKNVCLYIGKSGIPFYICL